MSLTDRFPSWFQCMCKMLRATDATRSLSLFACTELIFSKMALCISASPWHFIRISSASVPYIGQGTPKRRGHVGSGRTEELKQMTWQGKMRVYWVVEVINSSATFRVASPPPLLSTSRVFIGNCSHFLSFLNIFHIFHDYEHFTYSAEMI